MKNPMNQTYRDLIARCLMQQPTPARNGNRYTLPYAMLTAPLTIDGERVLACPTSKITPALSAIRELRAMLAGAHTKEQFHAAGVYWWDAWFISRDSLGQHSYGPQMALQLPAFYEGLVSDPFSHRHVMNWWTPQALDHNRAALPPCHMGVRVSIQPPVRAAGQPVLHLVLDQRSCDVGLGLPSNLAQYSWFAHALCERFGFEPGSFAWFGSNVHVYEQHIEGLSQLLRPTAHDDLAAVRLDGPVLMGEDPRLENPATRRIPLELIV